MTPAAGYMTAVEAAAYLKLASVASLHTFLYKRRKAGWPVTTYRRGRHLLFKQADLDAALTVERGRRALQAVK